MVGRHQLLTKRLTMPLNLFENASNLLPYQGCVEYFGKIFNNEEANYFQNQLFKHIEWRNDEALIFGKRIITKRKVAWYGEKPFAYTYSGVTKQALPWTEALLMLKKKVETTTKASYNSCLLNLYHDGDEGMAWHSDREADLLKNGSIASLSFGAERRFGFKHKQTGETLYILLEQGSLLEMKGETQTFWLHRLPPSKKIKTLRINLTFRTIIN